MSQRIGHGANYQSNDGRALRSDTVAHHALRFESVFVAHGQNAIGKDTDGDQAAQRHKRVFFHALAQLIPASGIVLVYLVIEVIL
ncbi:hypothetical protein BpHYR1_035104 [Brachionus plicatilis]|uniref:Uncharacterized protein n=1 Tax=Brachionus plicatilis TaxID=10195 RepID=A0A3M7P2T2_BRAPC|nr:hypothetical protein BpHYR1_035104 [Brachionus plicatilis]